LEAAMRQHTIALVDDDPAVRKALARLLSVLGYRLELFASAAEFLSAAATSEAVCLLIDTHLGDTLGLDLADQLSAAGFKFPTIFMSGSDDDTVREQCMDLGCVAYLQKPFPGGRLTDAIAAALAPDRQVA
jgi:FixJ family two-component response regulator